MTKYVIIDNFNGGYQNKIDVTKLSPGTLIVGSQNVEITDTGALSIRKGYVVDGVAGADVNDGIVSSFDWVTNSASERNIRGGGADGSGKLECRLVKSDGSVSYETILDGLNSTFFEFDTWWDADESIDVLLGVNGGTGIYSWSGAAAQVDITGSTSSTLKLQDTSTTWAAERFVVGGGSVTYDKKLTIGGIEYTYAGGEGTDTLTGVSPSPLAGGHTDGDWAIQTMTLHANKPASDASLFSNDIISVLYNQVWIGSFINREIYISDQSNFTDFTLTTPRKIGDPAIFNLDGVARAFIPNEESMFVSAGGEYWYVVNRQLSADLQDEELTIRVLKAGANQGAVSPGLTFPVKNNIAFVSNEPTLDTLGKIENITTSQTVALSDPIKNDFDAYDFNRGHGKFFRNDMYIALPVESRLLKFSIETGRWEAPWIMPAGRIAVIGGELYLHSSVSFTTYKLFSGNNDAGGAILAKGVFSYLNNGDRVNRKMFTERYTEGFISSNTTLLRKDIVEWESSGQENIAEMNGTDTRIILAPSYGNPLGKNPLGQQPLGSDILTVPAKQRFRVIHGIQPTDYREVKVVFESDGVDLNWEITAFGHDTQSSVHNNADITI